MGLVFMIGAPAWISGVPLVFLHTTTSKWVTSRKADLFLGAGHQFLGLAKMETNGKASFFGVPHFETHPKETSRHRFGNMAGLDVLVRSTNTEQSGAPCWSGRILGCTQK